MSATSKALWESLRALQGILALVLVVIGIALEATGQIKTDLLVLGFLLLILFSVGGRDNSGV